MKHNYLNSTMHNVAWLHKRYINDELELKAPFQRNPVWTNKQKSYLIDTILRGYPVPELYMQEFTDSSGNDVYTVVDGQQRVRSCVEFINGDYSLSHEDSPEWADMTFEELSDDDKKRIYNYNFIIRTLPDLPETELRAIFKRLNRHVVALNKQELRHATYWGQFIGTVERLADLEEWSQIALFTPNDVRRMLDIEYISELAIGLMHGIQNKKESLDKWYQSYEEDFPDRRRIERQFSVVLGELIAAMPNISRTRWRKKSDFYTLFLALAMFKENMPFDRDQRVALAENLILFGEQVDEYVKHGDEIANVPSSIRKYADAVERAASDLARRRVRRDQVVHVLQPILG